MPAIDASLVAPTPPSSNMPADGRPLPANPSHIAVRPWFHLPSPQVGPVQPPSPTTAAATVPHSSCSVSMAPSEISTPVSPGTDRASTAGELGNPSARGECPTIASTENIRSTSTGVDDSDVTSTRNTPTGSPLASASPGTSGFTADTRADTGNDGSASATRPNG